MSITLRVLGQVAPVAATETALYTCGTTSAVISSLYVCNTSLSVADTFTIRVNVAGAGDTAKQILFETAYIAPTTTVVVVSGITLAGTDVIKVTSTNGTTSFTLFGQENS